MRTYELPKSISEIDMCMPMIFLLLCFADALRGISHHRAAGRCKGRWSSGLPPFKKYSMYTCKCETHTVGRRTKGGPCEVSQAMEAHRSSMTLKLSVKEPHCGTFQPKTSGRVLLPLAVAAWTHQLLFHPYPSFLPL